MNEIIGKKIIRVSETESTNLMAKKMAESGEKEGTVILAERQKNGRGRMGRSFFSPGGSGIYMSVILKPENKDLLPVTSFAAVAVARAIKKKCGISVKIKWVNDLFLNGKKVCGILTEGLFIDDKFEYAILGIGLNAGKTDFPDELKSSATSLENETGIPIDREGLFTQILTELDKLYANYPSGAFLKESRELSCVIGKDVKVIRGKEEFFARAVGIDDNGGLLVEYGGKTQALYSGEISIRVV